MLDYTQFILSFFAHMMNILKNAKIRKKKFFFNTLDAPYSNRRVNEKNCILRA